LPSALTVLAPHYLGDAGDFLLVNRFARRTSWLHGVLTAYAGYGVVLFALLLVIGWWLARSARDLRAMAAVVWTAVGTLVAVAVNQPIASAVAERRPYQSIPHVLVLVSRTSDYGFPSDHATMAGAVAAGLCFVGRRLGIVAWVAAALMAFARVYVGAHYPHDVVAGLALGAAVVIVTGWLARPVLTRLLTRLAATPLRPVLTAHLPEPATAGAGGR
jgi:undecaprenyl-diphosphatase